MMTRWNQALWCDHRLDVGVARRLAHAFEMLGQRRDAGVQARHGEPHRRLLQRAAHGVDLVLGPGVVVVDEGAAARADGDEPGVLELAQRLAHRRLAGAELAGELQLDQPVAGRIAAVEDALQQRVRMRTLIGWWSKSHRLRLSARTVATIPILDCPPRLCELLTAKPRHPPRNRELGLSIAD